MKLKTLKDLATEGKYFDKEARLVSEEEIKKEVIKWIKELQKEKILLLNETTVKIEGIWFSFGMLSGALVILKKIFDISEVDLE